MNGASKRKKVYKAPYKRWADWEEEKLISYLKRNRPIEKPTAQAYYKKFIEESNFELDWPFITTKVKNMRRAYKKLKIRSNSRESCSTDQEESMRDVILKKYPVFKDYQEIFECGEDFDVGDLRKTEPGSESVHLDSSQFKFDDDSSQEKSLSVSECVDPKSCRSQRNSSCNGLSKVLEVQNKLLTLHKEIKEKEVKLKADELELQKEKFLFEQKKHAEYIQRREKELKLERKLKIMGMNMKKEIALKNIEMKERVEMERLQLGEMFNYFD